MLIFMLAALPSMAAANHFEVWLVDQSNTTGLAHGGRIHIFEGADLIGDDVDSAVPTHTIDLAGATAALCMANTGANPVRPHMLFFNAGQSHAILAFVASGHVVIFNAATRAPVGCVRTSAGAGGARQAHAAVPSDDERFIVVANQNGKLLERIETNYQTNVYTLNPAATLNLATCTTPNGVPCELAGVRSDNAPICPILDRSGRLAFTTLRGGGLFVVDPRTTPMSILAEYDQSTVHGNGCGGIEAGRGMFLNSGGGTPTNLSEFDVYRFPLRGYSPTNPVNTPARELIFSDDVDERDSHGMTVTNFDRFLWVDDRHANVIEIFHVRTGAHVNTLNLVGPHSDDPTPDLMDISPFGTHIFVSLRGPNPLSGDPHVSTGSTPGLMVLRVTHFGASGRVKGIARVSNVDGGGVERADPHGIRVRRK